MITNRSAKCFKTSYSKITCFSCGILKFGSNLSDHQQKLASAKISRSTNNISSLLFKSLKATKKSQQNDYWTIWRLLNSFIGSLNIRSRTSGFSMSKEAKVPKRLRASSMTSVLTYKKMILTIPSESYPTNIFQPYCSIYISNR